MKGIRLTMRHTTRKRGGIVRKYGVIYRLFLLVQKMRKTQRTYIEIQPVQS